MKNILNFTALLILLFNLGSADNPNKNKSASSCQKGVNMPLDSQPASLHNKSVPAFGQYYLYCKNELPPFDLILENPDTILQDLDKIDLDCLPKLLKKVEICILHQKDIRAYQFLEACVTKVDGKAATDLAISLERLWLTQNQFFIRLATKNRNLIQKSIPSLIIEELVFDLQMEEGFDQKLQEMNLQVEQLNLSEEEKKFVKDLHSNAFERYEIKRIFREFHKIDQDYRDVVIFNAGNYQANEVISLRKKRSSFVENELFPLFPIIKQQICNHENREVFSGLLKVILVSFGSAAEDFSDIMGEVFICKPQFMINYVTSHTDYRFLIRHIDFGFLNFQYSNPETPGLDEIKAKLDSLNEARPFRNY